MTIMEHLLRQNARAEKHVQDLETKDVVPVVARYTTNAGQSIPNNTSTIVNFEDVDYDPWATVTVGASWKFTAPVAGYYSVVARIMYAVSAGWADGEVANFSIFKNGALHSILDRQDNMPTGSAAQPGGSDEIHLAKGDYIDLRTTQNSGAAIALSTAAGHCRVAIHRIKG